MHNSFLHRPQRLFWRRAVFQIHLWAGTILGLYFFVIGLSGAALTFQREMMNDAPNLPNTAPQPTLSTYEALIETAHHSNPGTALQSIDMRSRERRVVSMTFLNGSLPVVLYFDRYTGALVRRSNLKKKHGVLVFLEGLHNELLGGRNGAIANGIGGVLLVLMCLTGMILWWPGKRIWKRALIVNWRARWPRINFDLHSAFGFWTLPLVFMWALTGAYFIFPDVIQKPFHLFAKPPTAQSSTWMPGIVMLPIDTYLAKAAMAFPRDQLAYVYMDVFRPQGQITVFEARDPATNLTLQEDIVYLDPATANILWTDSSDNWSLAEKILMASYAIHFGDFGGAASKTIWLLIGLALPLLAVTGYLMWWNRLLKKKWQIYFQARQLG